MRRKWYELEDSKVALGIIEDFRDAAQELVRELAFSEETALEKGERLEKLIDRFSLKMNNLYRFIERTREIEDWKLIRD